MIDKTESAVETLRSMDVSQRYSMPWDISPEAYKDLLDRVIDAPTDADGNLLDTGDEVTSDELANAFKIEYFTFDGAIWGARAFGASLPCSGLHRVVTDSRERIEADAEKDVCHYYGRDYLECDGCPARNAESCSPVMVLDLVRRCFALADGEKR